MDGSSTRQEFIRAAVSFLQNPKLLESPLKDKLKFLKDKGLNEMEIDEALNLALVNRNQSQSGKWNFLIILGLCVGGYKLYKAYLESKANYTTTGQKITQQQQQQQQREEIQLKERAEYDRLQQERDMPTLADILQKMAELKRLIELQRSNIASDIQSLKTLMLGHEKFAAPPVIPAWQLKDIDGKDDETNETKSKEATNKASKKKQNRNNGKDDSVGQSTNGFIETTMTPIGPTLD